MEAQVLEANLALTLELPVAENRDLKIDSLHQKL
jgi:hypothetical protein